MIIQGTFFLIETFSNRMIILEKRNSLHRFFNWHKDCCIKKRRYVILLTTGNNYHLIINKKAELK